MNKSENKFADVPIRVKTWVFIIIAFAIGISHPIAMTFFVSWLIFQSFFEFLRMFKVDTNRLMISVFVGFTQLLFLNFLDFQAFFLCNAALMLIILSCILFSKVSFSKIFNIGLALAICLFSFPFLYFIRTNLQGLNLIIVIVVTTELNDVFQYLMGKFFGKHKITPKISPNKTLEGFLGGVFLTIVLCNILGFLLLKSSIITNSILGLIIGLFGFFGDVFMSYLKRKANIKDTGNLLPGHGGLLDRMDSLVFNAPIFFWILPYVLKL